MLALIKKRIKNIFNRIKFRYLTTKYFFDKPKTLYHPLPWMGLKKSKRGKGSQIRLDFILDKIGDDRGSVFDFGSAEGFFAISLAEKGFYVLGLEAKKDRYEISKLVAEMIGLKNISFVNMKVDEKNLPAFPSFDFTICLAVWHHWVRYFGFESADKMLKTLWNKTGKYMFYETGLAELPDEFGMPKIKGDNDVWLLKYLNDTLSNSKISIIGLAPAFSPEQFKSKKTKYDNESFKRNIYCIEKVYK